jgi:predicted unusual protein kinase regulating ubiquinone biosynthesis (AarF/ABC1/UbiB family)
MEYLEDAVSLNRAVAFFAQRKQVRLQRKVARQFLYTMLYHILVHKECHGDLHPGNIMVDHTGKIFLIDWGNTIQLKGLWQHAWRYLCASLTGRVDEIVEAVIHVSVDSEQSRQQQDKLRESIRESLARSNVEPLGLDFTVTLYREGKEGLYRRSQQAMNLMSGLSKQGIVVKREYLHLSRSLTALVGSWLSIYQGVDHYIVIYCHQGSAGHPGQVPFRGGHGVPQGQYPGQIAGTTADAHV